MLKTFRRKKGKRHGTYHRISSAPSSAGLTKQDRHHRIDRAFRPHLRVLVSSVDSSPQEANANLANQLDLLDGLALIVLGSWLIYNLYIFLARIGGRKVDVAIWIIASLVTATYTFWAWSILDLNRWIMAKLFYRGVAPVEYAWSAQSKLLRKVWLEAHKVPVKPRL